MGELQDLAMAARDRTYAANGMEPPQREAEAEAEPEVEPEKGEVVAPQATAVEQQATHTHARALEAEITTGLREQAARAQTIERELLERAAEAEGKDVPGALRAVSDVKSKSLDGLLKITGRAAQPNEDNDLVRMVESMQRKGYLKLSVSLETGEKPESE